MWWINSSNAKQCKAISARICQLGWRSLLLGAGLALMIPGAYAAAPTTENFDGVTLGDAGGTFSYGASGSARVINNWTFTLLNAAGTQDVSSNAYVDVTNDSTYTSLADDGSDKAAYLNGNYAGGIGNAAAVLKATSGEEFSFVSIRVEVGASAGGDYRLVGYLDGNPASGATQNFTAGAFGSGGTLVTVSGAVWQFVDEVRVVRQNGETDVSIYVDDVVVSSAASPTPTITSATYNASTGALVVIGTNFTGTVGATNDVVANKFTLTAEGSAYTLTDTANVEISSATGFTLTLSATDRAALNLIANKNGTSSRNGIAYNIAGAAGFIADSAATADLTSNGVTVSNVAVPSITSATYDASTGVLVVTGTNYLSRSGATNDVVANKFTFTGQGGGTYTLTDTADVEITSGTSFTFTLSATDKSGVNLLLNKNGTSPVSGSAYNLGAAEDWAAGAEATVTVADSTGNGITASNVNATPTIGNLSGDTSAWAGVAASVLLDSSANASLADSELDALNGGNGNWAGGSLSVQRSGTAISTDTFGFDQSGALFSVSGSNLQAGGLTFATFTNAGGVLTISFTSGSTAATTALVNDVAQRITYRNDTPAGDAAVRFTLSDSSASATADVSVTSDAIYVTNTTDTATIDLSNGVSLSEAVAIAAADATGSQTIILGSSLTAQTINLASNLAINESLIINADAASSVRISSNTITLGSGNTMTWSNSTGINYIGSTLAGAGGLSKTGAGTLSLESTSNNGGWSGAMLVIGGTLSAGTNTRLSSGALTLDGGTLNMTVAGSAGTTTVVTNAVTLGAGGGVIQIGGGGGANIAHFSGAISGSGNLVKSSAAILQLSGTNSYTGTTTISAGTLSLASDSNLGSGTLIFNSGTLQVTATTTIDNAITLTNDGTVQLDANASFAGQLSGAYRVNKTGVGTLTLSNSNNASMAGEINVVTGIVSVADGAYLPSTIVLGGGDLSVTSATTVNAVVAVQADTTITIGAAVSFANIVEQGNASHTMTKNGAGTLTLASVGNSQFMEGDIAVTAGTLSISDDRNLSTGNLVLNGGTLAITATGTYDNALSLGGSGGGITTSTGISANWSGIFSGAGSLTKLGAGSLQLSATNTHTGTSTISAGTLLVSGSTASATLVASGATLAGTGTLGGAVIVQSGGSLAPGAGGAGVITLSNGLTISSGGSLLVDIAGAAAGTGYDQVAITGAVDVSSATITATHSYTPGSAASYVIIANDDTDSITGTFSGVSEGATFAAGGNSTNLTASYSGGTGNDFTLTAPTFPSVISVTTSTSNGTYKIGDTLTIAVNFSEAVSLTTGTLQLTLETGTTDRVLSYQSGSGSSTLSFSYTVQAGDNSADLDYVTTTALAANGDTVQNASFVGAILTLPTPGASGSLSAGAALVVDGVRPTAAIVVADTALAVGETSLVTMTFSESVSGFTTADLTVANGVLSNLSSADGGITWTATLTPSASVTDTTNVISLDNTGVADVAGNAGTGTTDSNNFAIDTARPTASIVVADSSLIIGETSLVTFTFSEAVTGFTNADLAIESGVLGAVSSSDGGVTWTATLTPTASLEDTTNVITLDNTGVADAAGNAGTGITSSNNYAVDTLRPAISGTITVSDTALKTGDTATVTFTFTEAIAGFTTTDLTVENAVATSLSSTDGGTTWTATLTPNTNVTDATNVITVDLTALQDLAGNTGLATATSENYAVDSSAPSVTSVGVPVDGSYTTAQVLSLSVNTDSNITVDTTGGTPRIAIVLESATQYASYVSGSGTSTLVFSYSVQANDTDNDGIALGASIEANGGSLRDDADNDMALALNAVGSTAGVLVDTTVPADTLVTTPASSVYSNAADYAIAGTHGENGVTIKLYADADNDGAADNSTVLDSVLVASSAWSLTAPLNTNAANNFVVIAVDGAGNVSAAVDVPTITQDSLAPAAPAALDLATASDTGANTTDDITKETNPTVTGTAEANASISLTSDLDGVIGTATADGSGDWSITTASALTEGAHSLTATATDAATNQGVASAALVVTVDTSAPTVSTVANQNLIVGASTGALAVTLSDNISSSVNLTLTSASSNISAVSLAAIALGGSAANRTVTATATGAGSSTITLTVEDEAGNTASSNFAVSVNSAPTISGTPAVTVNENSAYSFTPSAFDGDGNTLVFGIINKPTWASFNSATGQLSGTPVQADVGATTNIQISVTDGIQTVNLAVFNLTVVNVNDAPIISGTPIISVNQDAVYSFTPTASDVDTGTTLIFSISNAPSWASFDTATGALTGTPTNEDVGTASNIVISVSDGTLSASLTAFSIAVTNTNDAPTITGTPATTVAEDSAYSFTPVGADVDAGDSLTYSITNKPSWASFNTATGALTGTPANDDVGVASNIVISVSDGTTSADLAAFGIIVSNSNDTPTDIALSNLPIKQSAGANAVVGTLTTTDVDSGDAFSYSLVAGTGSADNALFNINGDQLRANDASALAMGNYSVRVQTSDGTATFAKAFSLSVVDDITATVSSVTAPAAGTYGVGSTLNVVVNYSEAITVDTGAGTPRIALTLGTATRYAVYAAGSDSASLSFQYTVAEGDEDTDGITIAATIDTNGANLVDAGDLAASTALTNLGTVTTVLVDGIVPTLAELTAVNSPINDAMPTVVFSSTEAGTVGLAGSCGTSTDLAITAGDVTLTLAAADNSSALAEGMYSDCTVTVTDAAGNVSEPLALTAFTLDTTAPTLTVNEPLALDEGASATLSEAELSATDAISSGTGIVYTLSALPANGVLQLRGTDLLVDSTFSQDDIDNGRITYSHNASETTTDSVQFTVQDEAGNVSEGTVGEGQSNAYRFTMAISAVNDAPTLSGNPATTIAEGNSYSFTAVASDADVGDTLTFSVANAPGWLSINPVTGVLSGVPSNADVGIADNIVVSVTDGTATAALPAFAVTVTNINDAPTLMGTPPLGATVGTAYSFAPEAADADVGDVLSFTATGLPAWASVNSSTGVISGIPAAADVGSATITLTVSDGTASTSLPAFTVQVISSIDTDGDTISDFQEGLDGTDPNDPTDYLDLEAPVIITPAAITVDANALFTPVTVRTLLGLAASASDTALLQAQTAFTQDNVDGSACCIVTVKGATASGGVVLAPGRNAVVWQASDAKGNVAEVSQQVDVRPLVSLSKDRVSVEGASVKLRVILNGKSPVYPFTVPLIIDSASTAAASDHDFSDRAVTLTEGQTEATVTVQLASDDVVAGERVLAIALDDRTSDAEDLAEGYNAQDPNIFDINAGAKTHYNLTITEGNIAPAVSLLLEQNGLPTVIVSPSGGEVRVLAIVTDDNPGDSHSFDWSSTDATLVDTDGSITDMTLVFDPSALAIGRAKIQVTVNDGNGGTKTAKLYFRVLATLPVLDTADSDGDGVEDIIEGAGDIDDDGIPDYLDNISASNLLPEVASETATYLLECDPGVRCRLGQFALLGSTGGARLSDDDITAQTDIGKDTDFEPMGGIFDFEIADLPTAGQSARIVVPQVAAIPNAAVYRKFQNGRWATFVQNVNNALHSTQGGEGYCPPPGDASWQAGLVEGYFCVQLTIEDGGPNDADGLVNANVEDPGVVAVPIAVTPEPTPVTQVRTRSSGGSIGGNILVLLAALVFIRRKTKARFSHISNKPKLVLALAVASLFVLPSPYLQTQAHAQQLSVQFSSDYAMGSASKSALSDALASDVESLDIQQFDTSRISYRLGFVFQFADEARFKGLGLGLAYLDLGEVIVNLDAQITDEDAFVKHLNKNYPVTAKGLVLSYFYSVPFKQKYEATFEAGLFSWNGDRTSSGVRLTKGYSHDLSPLISANFAYKMNKQVSAGVRYSHIFFNDQSVDSLGLFIQYGFGD